MSATTTLLKFNTETTPNCPKFELKTGLQSVQRSDITLTVLGDDIEPAIINDIITFYEMTGNPEFITQNMVIPFSFLLVDLNVHKPQYSAFIFIQPYDINTYFIEHLEDSPVIEIGSTTDRNNVKGGVLQNGKIFIFVLDAKAISQWKLDSVAIIGTPPPFYVSETDFYQMLVTDEMTGDDTGFLLDTLQKIGATSNNALYYNYRVGQILRMGSKFSHSEYLKKHKIVEYYLLIHPISRFNKREEIISKISA